MNRRTSLMRMAIETSLDPKRVDVAGVFARGDSGMALFARTPQMACRMREDALDMPDPQNRQVRDRLRRRSQRRRHLHVLVLRHEMASRAGASAPFETHSVARTGRDRFNRVTRHAGKTVTTRLPSHQAPMHAVIESLLV